VRCGPCTAEGAFPSWPPWAAVSFLGPEQHAPMTACHDRLEAGNCIWSDSVFRIAAAVLLSCLVLSQDLARASRLEASLPVRHLTPHELSVRVKTVKQRCQHEKQGAEIGSCQFTTRRLRVCVQPGASRVLVQAEIHKEMRFVVH
jgi:hypothetical protein